MKHVEDRQFSAHGSETISGSFHFEPKSATISKDDEGKIEEVAELLNRMKVIAVKIRVEGHTDAFESKKDSVDLSARRARAVFDRLVEAGIKPERLTAVGFGMERPVADNGKKEGRAANRRVEFQVLETDPPILDDCVER